jgi:hypothetical protein
MAGGIILAVIRGDGDWLAMFRRRDSKRLDEGSGVSSRCRDLAPTIGEE